MSVEAVNQFLQKVNENTELQRELSRAEDNIAIVELAAKWGYEFTESEMSQQTQRLQTMLQRQATGYVSEDEFAELSEDELLAIAGGIKAMAADTCCGQGATSGAAAV